MRLPEFGRRDNTELEPQVQRELAAVEAGLAGMEVHPDYSELASLAVAIRDEAPDIDAEFAAVLDERAAAGFPRAPVPGAARETGRRLRESLDAIRPRRLIPVAGAAASLLVVTAVAISVVGDNGSSTSPSSTVTSSPDAASAGASASAAKPSAGSALSGSAGSATAAPSAGGLNKDRPIVHDQRRQLAPAAPEALPSLNGPSVASSAPAGRHVSQKASMTISTDPDKVRGIAASVTSIVARHHGLVVSSQITSGAGSSGGGGGPVPQPLPEEPLPFATGALGAEFQLRIPANELDATLDDLSGLGLVVSRDQGTQDITGSFHSVHGRIQDLRSERDKLLGELPSAVSQDAIDAINHRLGVIRSQLAGSESQLGHLKQRVAIVPVHVSVVAKGSGGGGSSFDLGQAAHDAGRVLVVGAGVALISLAVIVPLGLIAGLVWLATSRARRSRRERALDER